jgi:predicted Rossmann fold nucleotide-binding protein DprA/Smf involved in DNA uptake
LKQHLGDAAPPVLFGYGDQQHMQRGGVAMVGSRDATPADLALAGQLGGLVSRAGYPVISGGARGIDQQAADGALAHGGPVVAVLADAMLRTATRPDYRKHLLAGNVTLLTPYSPEAGFSAGNAMGRNRLIYCLSGAAVAVCSAPGKGGTFTGAAESLNRGWVPVWTVPNDDPASGNSLLIAKGAGVLPALTDFDVQTLFERGAPSRQPDAAQTSFIG